MTASSSGCTPLFLKLEPHSTGVILFASVAARIASLSRSAGISCVLEDHLEQLVVVLGRPPRAGARARPRPRRRSSAGISTTSCSLPSSSL